MEERKVNRGLHGFSAGTIVAAIFLLLSHPKEVGNLVWFIDKAEVVQQNVNVVPQLQSSAVELKIRLDKMEARHKHLTDSLTQALVKLQHSINVMKSGKQPYDSVMINGKQFHITTKWLWRVPSND